MNPTWRILLTLFLTIALWLAGTRAYSAPPQPPPPSISSPPVPVNPPSITSAEASADWQPVSTFVHLYQISAGDGEPDDFFGQSVATDGQYLVVGVPGDTVDGKDGRGSVYIYVRGEGVWTLDGKVTAGDGAADDQFGGAVAISGDTIVVGAALRDEGSDDDQGAAYVFVRGEGGWIQQQKLTAQEGLAGDHFGQAVAVYGNVVLVGAPLDDDDVNNRENQGAGYVFERFGSIWLEQNKLTHSMPAAHDNLGNAVALMGDVAVVGAPQRKVGADDKEGSVYVFTREGALWSQRQLIASAATAGARFGDAVAFDGDRITVGAPFDNTLTGETFGQGAAFVFERVGSGWIEDQKLTPANGSPLDAFGQAVGIDGNAVVVGAFGEDFAGGMNQGAAHVFVDGDSGWQMKHLLVLPGASGNEAYGLSVAISGDTIAAGAPNASVQSSTDQGVVCISQRSRVDWIGQKATHGSSANGEHLGRAIAMDGGVLVASAPGAENAEHVPTGAAYVYAESGDDWVEQQQLFGSTAHNDYGYGKAVAISGDALAVGAHTAPKDVYDDVGRVFVYEQGDSGWSEVKTLYPDQEASHQEFGASLDIDGGTLVVGARWDSSLHSEAGAAYVFVRGPSGWSQQQKLSASDASNNDGFGRAVSVDGDTIVVGTVGTSQAYVFERNGTAWTERPKLQPVGCATGCEFGYAVDLDGDTVAIGAPMDGGGAVYIFTRAGAGWQQEQRLTASDGLAIGTGFGTSVALHGVTLVVGHSNAGLSPASLVQTAANIEERGAGYVFVRSATGWVQQAKLEDIAIDSDAHFGASATVFGDTVVFGAPDGSSSTSGEGSLFIHRRIRLAQSISFGALPDKSIGDPSFQLNATASSGLPVTFGSKTTPVCTVTGKTVTLVAAGTCTIAANQPGDGTYATAAEVTRSFAVIKISQSISFGVLADRALGELPFQVSATASSGLPVTFSSKTKSICTVTGKMVALVAGGICTIAANQSGNGTHAPAAEVTQSFAIAKIDQRISFAALASRSLANRSFQLEATTSSGLPVDFGSKTRTVCTVAGKTVTLLAAGTCTIAANQPGNGTYAPAAEVTQSFAVLGIHGSSSRGLFMPSLRKE